MSFWCIQFSQKTNENDSTWGHREKNRLEPKAECYANDKVKSPPVFWSLYDDF